LATYARRHHEPHYPAPLTIAHPYARSPIDVVGVPLLYAVCSFHPRVDRGRESAVLVGRLPGAAPLFGAVLA
jgi:hypothetical protein